MRSLVAILVAALIWAVGLMSFAARIAALIAFGSDGNVDPAPIGSQLGNPMK